MQRTGKAVRIAVAPVLSIKANVLTYQRLLAYLEKRLGRPVEMIQRRTYAEVNDLLRTGSVDVAFICGGAYVAARMQFPLELLAAPVRGGKPEYYSYLVVSSESHATGLEDLKGKAFAFSDPLSNSGRLVPAYLLLKRGERPETFFSRVIYTYSHDNSVRAVADGLVDAAAVDSLVYERAVVTDPELATRTRVLARYGPYGSPPVVAPSGADPSLKDAVRHALLGMSSDPEGQGILAGLGVDGFTEVTPALYDEIEEMYRLVFSLDRGA